MKLRSRNQPLSAVQSRVIVGFDSEWTFAKEGENRILSWQFVVLNADTAAASETFIEPKGPTRRHRVSLSGGLSKALHKAYSEGVIPCLPKELKVACHFARADITTLRDYNMIKPHLTAVRKTYTTTRKRLKLRIVTPDGAVQCNVRLVDTALLTAANTKLERLGADLGLPKVTLPGGYTKGRMDLFLAERRDEFIDYAMTDARIAALWAARIDEIFASLGVAGGSATLGAASVFLARKELAKLPVDSNEFLGLDKPKRGKPRPKASLVGTWPYAAQCYHGGLNVAFAVGLSPEGRDLIDVDLKSAYTTALALIRIPDWSTARPAVDLAELAMADDAMTFAHVKFAFPTETRFPSLPVRATNKRGLVYPLEGESWCTGPEILVALRQGARIEPLSGWRIDWRPGPAVRPFESFTRRINEIRARAKAATDVILDKTVKEIGNSLYGKLAQAVASRRIIPDDVVYRRTFDTKSGRSAILGQSPISQPMFAAYCTGLVRAALCEALCSLPKDAWVATATTDGFLFAGDIYDIDTSGPIACAFAAARERITPENREIWEVKHRIPRALIMKTRGTFTVAPPDWRGEALCAQAGYRLPDADAAWLNDHERSTRWIEHYRGRQYETRFENPSLTSLRDQHNKGLDLQSVERLVRWNIDFDFKRRLINIRDIDGLIAADTVPWRTADEFEDVRDGFEAWSRAQRRVLKTTLDLDDMTVWVAGRASRKAVGARAHNHLSPLARATMLASIHGVLGAERTPYKRIARRWSRLCHVPIGTANVKDVKRRGAAPHALAGSIDFFTEEDEAFVAALLRYRIDAMDLLQRICKPGSAAQTHLFDALHCVSLEGAAEREPDFMSRDEPDFPFEPDFEVEGEPAFDLEDKEIFPLQEELDCPPDFEPDLGPIDGSGYVLPHDLLDRESAQLDALGIPPTSKRSTRASI
jgi:hypothetical protein